MHFSLPRRKQLFPIRHWNEHENSFHFPSLSTLIALEEKVGPKPSLLTIKVECQIFVPIIIVIIAVQKPFFLSSTALEHISRDYILRGYRRKGLFLGSNGTAISKVSERMFGENKRCAGAR